jgi:hypothetical protein
VTAADVGALLDEALDEFDKPGMSLSANVRRAHRIASLRHDLINLYWLQLELTDMAVGKRGDRTRDPHTSRIRDQIDSLLGAKDGRKAGFSGYLQWERNRTALIDGENMVFATSIGQLEVDLASQQALYDEQVPTNLSADAAYLTMRQMESGKASLLMNIQRIQAIIERVRTAVHTFLVNTEAEVDAGQQVASVFTRAQQYVNAALQKIAPDALSKFVSAQDRLYSEDPEGPSHALTSCRRMIKALADALYPATDQTVTGDDGIGRVMSDDLYRNRLVQWVRETIGRHAQTDVIKDTIASFGSRLKSLDSLASKGVHDKVTVAEAETCVVWTYMLAADLLRLADGTSAVLAPAGEAAPE